MGTTTWYGALELITPYVFKILTPGGFGSGFQIFYTKTKKLCGVATALHVIEHAHNWEEPIKLEHYSSGKTNILREEDRAIFSYPDKDLAFILFDVNDLPLQSQSLKLIDEKKFVKQGVETGWCGFPAISPHDLCFFTGHISCYLKEQKSYLVDGVAINGVSGGPSFFISQSSETPKICGVISAYMPNRVAGGTLPGVCIVRSVEPYQERLKLFESLYEATEEAETIKEKPDTKKAYKSKKKPVLKKKPVAKIK